jgi:hypothetical protein
MNVALTCNGPGETAGWLRPFLHELYARAPDAGVHVFFVPDDYATGREPHLVREIFPQARVYDPKTYLKVALGGRADGLPERVDAVIYFGGDLMHAARLCNRLGGALFSYKFSNRRMAERSARVYAVDEANAAQLASCGVEADRIMRVGNLAIDGAMLESAGDPEPGAPHGGVLIMPGSRKYEVQHLIPFFYTAALAMRREDPQLPIAFGIAPFTEIQAVRQALEAGGDARVYARRGTVAGGAISSVDGSVRFPILHRPLASARTARLALTIPGTKVIELAALGVPVVSCSPANAPELAPINGPLTYINRIPLVGVPAKRAIVMAYSRRFPFHTQPNIDAGKMLVRELHGTLTPGRVARVTLDCLHDAAWLEGSSRALRELYGEQAGAASRMVQDVIGLVRT